MSALPKAGIAVDDLKCKKCGKKMSEVKTESPVGKIHCDQEECPQKLKTT